MEVRFYLDRVLFNQVVSKPYTNSYLVEPVENLKIGANG